MNKDQTRDRDVSKDLGTSSDRAIYSPSEARGRGESSERNQGGTQPDRQDEGSQQDSGDPLGQRNDREQQDQQELPVRGGGQDAGRTQGGGSGGHSPSRDVQEQTNVRNNSRVRDE